MTAVDWEEVKRLAADFQRAQLTSTSQTLSERNCIEIIRKLIDLNLLDVIFTTDGKEYITPQYLIKEIKDELYVSGGRINLVELAHTLNVDLSYVHIKAAEVERSTPGCCIIMGQLIDKQYLTTICTEINEKLKEKGQVTISELTRTYDLPSDFIQGVVEKNLGKLIFGKQDKSDARVFFTEAFVEHNKCVVRGALSALTKPTQVSFIMQLCEIRERDFYMAFESLIEGKQISGVLTGKQGLNCLYIPSIYTKQQNEWVDNFYQQNGYLEYDALSRLGITEPINFVRRHFAGKGLVELASCAIGPQLISQAHSAVEEVLVSGSSLDLSMMLPSVLSEEDIGKVLEIVLKQCKSKAAVHVFCQTIIVTGKFLEEISKPFYSEGIIKKNADQAVSSGAYLQLQVEKKLKGKTDDHEDSKAERREERRRKATGGKGGGGTQGRETKTKSLKKKTDRRGKAEVVDSDEEVESNKKRGDLKLELISVEEIEKVLSDGALEEGGEELVVEVARHLHASLNKAAMQAAQEAFERCSGGARRKMHADVQEAVDSLLMEIRSADRGVRLVGGDGQAKLATHLIKTLCSDLVTAVIGYVNGTGGGAGGGDKSKLLLDLPPDTKGPLTKLFKAVTIEEFTAALDPAITAAGLILRKQDKKKEKSWLQERRETLIEKLLGTDDPALALHLAVLILFQTAHHNIVHASGKFVPMLLTFLKPQLSDEQFLMLHKYQDHVLQLLRAGDDTELASEAKGKLDEGLVPIRDLVMNFKKHLPSASSEKST